MPARSIMYHDVVENGDFASSGFPGEDFERHLAALAPAMGGVPEDQFHFNRGDGDGPIHL